jgi:hypothetical protein
MNIEVSVPSNETRGFVYPIGSIVNTLTVSTNSLAMWHLLAFGLRFALGAGSMQ